MFFLKTFNFQVKPKTWNLVAIVFPSLLIFLLKKAIHVPQNVIVPFIITTDTFSLLFCI